MMPAAQQHRPLHLRTAQVQVAVPQPQVLARQFLLGWGEWQMRTAVEHLECLRAQFDRTGGQPGIDGSLRSRRDLAGHPHHELVAHPAGLLHNPRARFRAGDNLRLAIAVAEVQEHGAAVIANTVHPPAKRDFLTHVLNSQLATCMCA